MGLIGLPGVSGCHVLMVNDDQLKQYQAKSEEVGDGRI